MRSKKIYSPNFNMIFLMSRIDINHKTKLMLNKSIFHSVFGGFSSCDFLLIDQLDY